MAELYSRTNAPHAVLWTEDHSLADSESIELPLVRPSPLENSYEGMFRSTPEGRHLAANQALARILGYSDASELLSNLTDIGHQLYVNPKRREELLTLLASHETVTSFESEVRRKDGSTIWISETAWSVRDGAGEFLFYEGTVVDITDRFIAQRSLEDAEAKYRSIFENAIEGIFQTTPSGNYLAANPALAEIYGYKSPDELCQSLVDISHQLYVDPARREEFAATLEREDLVSSFESQVYRKDGTIIWISESARAVRDESQQLLYYEGTVVDITDRKHAEEALEQSQQRLKQHFHQTPLAVIEWDLEGRITEWNPAAERIFGHLRREAVGVSGIELLCPPHVREQMRVIWQELLERRGGEQITVENATRSGRRITCDWYNAVLRDSEGNPIAVSSLVLDNTDRKLAEERLIYDAFHDTLTGLPNRALFLDRLGHCFEISKRRQLFGFGVLFLDLDRFKVINDSMGHVAGDLLLCEIAHRLENCLRPGDTIARLGGDEFGILVEGITDVGDAIRVAERIQETFSRPFSLVGQEVFTNASIGIATDSLHYQLPEDILRDADTAMYRAKSLGTARFAVFHSTMHERVVAQLKLETDLRLALQRNQFVLHYQPIIDLKTGRIDSMEALIRWSHPDRGMVSPDQFIPLSEETGAIIEIGDWVLQEACRQAKVWADMFPDRELAVNVNLSGKQLIQANLAVRIQALLREAALPPEYLRLEITESVVMEHAEVTMALLRDLRALNVRLQMDDFGTGYSSLSYLHRFPIDTLKIDRTFVRQMVPGGDEAEIVATILSLAKILNKETTAEGIETPEQLAMLRQHQCGRGQGFFFSRPVPADAATQLLANNPIW